MEHKKGLKAFFGEFKTFITRGNVLDMAVGVIVGGAFTAIVTALSDHILHPLINWVLFAIFGGDGNSLSEIYTVLKGVTDETGALILEQSIYIDWGAFINAIINFLLIAFVLFCIVKAINNMSAAHQEEKAERKALAAYRKQGMSKEAARKQLEADLAKAAAEQAAAEQAAAEAAAAAAKAEEEKATANTRLLEEIRDLLKKAQ